MTLSSLTTAEPVNFSCPVSSEGFVCPGQVVTCLCVVKFSNGTGGTIRWSSNEYIGLQNLELALYQSPGDKASSLTNPDTEAMLTRKDLESQTMESSLRFIVSSDSAKKFSIVCSSADQKSRNITLFLPSKLKLCIYISLDSKSEISLSEISATLVIVTIIKLPCMQYVNLIAFEY